MSLPLVAVALFLQALLLPLHGPQPADAGAAALAELSGAVAVESALCGRTGESGPAHKSPDCGDHCLLCQFPGNSGLLAPIPPSLIEATLSAPMNLRPLAGADPPAQASRFSRAQPRAPPRFA